MADPPDGAPKLYSSLAGWYHLLTAPEDYAEEAAFYTRLLVSAGRIPVKSVLELGSGGGANASFMKRDFDLTLTDISPEMLEISRSINPELEHIEGDMRTLRLGRTFDGVFVHDAVTYMTTEDDLRAAIETAAVHCERGGPVVFAPDDLTENFKPGTDTGGHDGPDGRALRYMEWQRAPDAAVTVTDFAYLLREADGSVRAVHDRHYHGLFPRDTWLRLLDGAGFEAAAVPFVHSEVEAGSMEVFVGVRR